MNSVDGSARGRLLEHRALKSFPRAKGLECGTLWQIQSFIAVAEAGSITLAADRINISQPSISTAIAHLDQELDVQPFVRRHAQNLMLTAVGKTLLIEAKRLIERAEQLYAVASDVTNDVRGRLSLGCMILSRR